MDKLIMRSALCLGLLLVASCGDGREPLGCTDDDTCPSGHGCLKGKCAQLCDNDADCTNGYVCEADVCTPGSPRGKPEITAVFGDGSNSCPSAVSGSCLNDHLVVEGQNLTGAAFRIKNATREFVLPTSPGGSSTQVSILLPSDLVPGDFTLVAQNEAGDDSESVKILQGEPGENGGAASGNEILVRLNETGTTGRLVVERMPTANVLIGHLNSGDGSVKISAALLPAGGGGGAFTDGDDVVTLLNGGTTSTQILNTRVQAPSGTTIISAINAAGSGTIGEARLPETRMLFTDNVANDTGVTIPITDLAELCADGDGCNVTIGMRQVDRDGASTGAADPAPATATAAISWLRSCRIDFAFSGGEWYFATPSHCSYAYGAAGGGWLWEYSTSIQGELGDGDPDLILASWVGDENDDHPTRPGGYACYFGDGSSESGDIPADGSLGNIRELVGNTNLHFYMRKTAIQQYFANSGRSCELLIED